MRLPADECSHRRRSLIINTVRIDFPMTNQFSDFPVLVGGGGLGGAGGREDRRFVSWENVQWSVVCQEIGDWSRLADITAVPERCSYFIACWLRSKQVSAVGH